MKNSLIILILILFSQNGLSQNYESVFGKTSTEWFQARTAIDRINDIYITPIADTLINSITFKELFVEGIQLNDSSLFIREDTLTGKIWVLDSWDDKEYLLMDLSLSKGDTFKVSASFSYSDSIAIVDSVYFLEGTKIIELNYVIQVNAVEKNLAFIEGIGPNAGFLYQVLSIHENGADNQFLLCSYRDGVLAFRDSANSMESCLFKPEENYINQESEIRIDYYPNPADDYLYIITDVAMTGKLEIYTLTGQLLYSIDFKNAQTIQVPVPGYPDGLYNLILKQGGEVIKAAIFQIVH